MWRILENEEYVENKSRFEENLVHLYELIGQRMSFLKKIILAILHCDTLLRDISQKLQFLLFYLNMISSLTISANKNLIADLSSFFFTY